MYTAMIAVIEMRQQFAFIMLSKKKEQKYIYAIRNRIIQQGKSGKPEAINQTIGALSSNFILAIAPEINHQLLDGQIVEQEKSKFGQYLYSFEVKGSIKIIPQNVLVSFPIFCNEEDGKFQLTQDEFKKFIFQFKTILTHDESDDSSYSRYSESQQQISSIDHRCRGRPKGSKNRRKESIEKSSEQEFLDQSNKKFQEKRGRGRPKGAKNIKKQMSTSSDNNLNELNVFQLFVHLFETKSIQEVNTKVNRLKDKDDRLLMVKKQELQGEQMIKRSRGRPKGVKNKPKLNNQQSQSEQTQQIQSLPKRKQTKGFAFGKCCNSCHEKQKKKFFLEGKAPLMDDISNISERISTQNNQCIILHVIKSGNLDLIKQVLSKKNVINYPFIVSWDCYSRLQQCSYTIKTKKDYVYRGKREGINALIQDCYRGYEIIWWKILGVDRLLQSIPNNKQAVQIYELLIKEDLELKKQIYQNISSLVRSGNQTLASYLLQRVLKQEDNTSIYGYSKDHLQCLSKKKNQIQFKKSTMLKQSYTTNFCSPIHCATINSNIDLLSFILKHISDFNVGDSLNRKPIHYAAVLQNSKALQILIKHGADLKDMDKRKMTPLMLAAKFGRLKNIKIILDKVKDPHYINFKGDEGLAALHYAVIEKHFDQAILLLEDPLIEKQIQTKQGMSIFHIAAGNGQKDMIKALLQRGFNPEQPDNYRRTPLMIAIRNYQNDIFFQIFNHLQRYYKRDYSYNTLLHYAAAYGNMEIVKFFIEIGMSQTMNRKSLYPFQIAILKGHYQCAKILQNWTLHFSHHLLNRLSKNPRGTEEYFEIFEYLLETRKYDLNYRNPAAYGYTCLHFICSISESEYNNMRSLESTVIIANEYKVMQERLIGLLLKYGANPDIQNQKGQKPLKLCIENQNIVGIQLLLTEIPFDLHPPTRNNNYVYYLTNIGCLGWKEMEFIYQKLSSTDEKILRGELKKIDINGFEFLIYLIKKFTETVHNNFRNAFVNYRNQITAESPHLKKEEIDKMAVLKAFSDYLKHQQILIKTVNLLVDNGSDPKFIVSEPKMDQQYQNYKKWGIQHFLMKFPSLNLLKIFMKWIDTHFNLQNSQGRTPLHLFCLWNNEGNLFNNYASPNDPLPVIDYVQMNLFQGKKCLQYLLQNGLTCNVLDINRSTPLLYAATRGQLGFIKLLRNFGSTINNVNSLNQVPLIELIRQKNKFSLAQIDSILFDEGLRPDFKDLNQRNALHHLVSIAKNFDNSPQICSKLLEYGVNINSLDKFGRSPIFYCFIKIEQNEYSNDDSNDKVQILQSLLTHADLNINIVDMYQRTPLHYACEKQFFFSILYLLQKNIDYDVVDAEGNTPLAICLKHKNLNQAAMLIKRGVKYGNVVEDGQLYSYITYSIKKLSIAICFILIDHGYPLEKALEESSPYREMLIKRYVR